MSYLLHFDPAGATAGELRTVTGSVTFASDIIGLVTDNAQLAAMDSRVGSVGDYGTNARGIAWASGDYLTVSSDQKTLSFRLSTLSDQLLQFRVLTELKFGGDFNNDGNVDAADLTAWRAAVGGNAQADSDGDGDSDGADFLRWQRQLGSFTVPATVASVPEASSLALLSLALVAFAAFRPATRERS